MMTPARVTSTVCPAPWVPNTSPVVFATTMSCTSAIGVSQRDSSVRPLIASTFGPICFFTRPYAPNDAARVSAIQGKVPYATMITTTATTAIAIAAHCAGRSRSCSTSTPSSTVTIGLMK